MTIEERMEEFKAKNRDFLATRPIAVSRSEQFNTELIELIAKYRDLGVTYTWISDDEKAALRQSRKGPVR